MVLIEAKKNNFFGSWEPDMKVNLSWFSWRTVIATLRWCLHFTIVIRLGWSILFDSGWVFCDSGKFRLITILEKKSLKVYAIFCSWNISSSSSIRVIFFMFLMQCAKSIDKYGIKK